MFRYDADVTSTRVGLVDTVEVAIGVPKCPFVPRTGAP
jgi:hypothetical protein